MAGDEENWYLSLICVLVLCVSFSNDGSNN